jgi:hypothetical protein
VVLGNGSPVRARVTGSSAVPPVTGVSQAASSQKRSVSLSVYVPAPSTPGTCVWKVTLPPVGESISKEASLITPPPQP